MAVQRQYPDVSELEHRAYLLAGEVLVIGSILTLILLFLALGFVCYLLSPLAEAVTDWLNQPPKQYPRIEAALQAIVLLIAGVLVLYSVATDLLLQ